MAEPGGKTKAASVAAVLALGAALRLWALGFGMPVVSNFYVRPDESLIVQAALLFFERHGHPQFFAYPALLTELCAVLFAAIPEEFAANPSAYFLAVRSVSAAAGIATVGVVYLIARRFFPWAWALSAAAFYAVAPLPVRDAHFGVTDTLMTLLVALALWMAVRHAQEAEPRSRLWVGTSLLFGLAISTKYTAVLVAPALLVSALAGRALIQDARHGRAFARRVTQAVAIAAVVFFALNPYILLRAREVLDTALGMIHVFYGGAAGLPESAWSWSGAALQVLRPLAWGPGSWLALPLAACSAIWLLRRGERTPGLAVLAWGVFPFLLALLPFRHPLPFRYLLPALPGLAVLAVFAAFRLARRRRLAVPVAAVGGVVFLWQLALSTVLVSTLAKEDTRTLAGQWIAANVSRETPIVMLGAPEGEPQVSESAASLERRIAYVYRLYGEQSGMIVSELYRVLQAGAPEGYEIYRNPASTEAPAGDFLLVVSEYPMRAVEGSGAGGSVADGNVEGRVKEFGEARERVEFDPINGPMQDASFDPSDAFYLPMNPWGKVERPGPRLKLFRMTRTTLP
ncbi:MAG: glycosyltransferase family 39 protein [Bryobacterales bacterium]|nr:glycosyltransferase family 39 protein [Bryobacterales bacterium]